MRQEERQRQLEMARTFTNKEVMASAIAKLRTLTINELRVEEDPTNRKMLEERQLLLEYEKMAVLGDDYVAKSIQDKVVRLYSPLLKSYYAQK